MKLSIVDIKEEDRMLIYSAIELIKEAIKRNNGTSFQSFIDDFENNSLIRLTLTESKK